MKSKDKIVCILIGMFLMGVLVGCGQAVQKAIAGENDYLQYCGSQSNILGSKYKYVEVYEDNEHGNVVYAIGVDGQNTLNISVVPKHTK